MNTSQRVVAVLYCLLVVYCAVWVPWIGSFGDLKDIQQGYGWVWSPPFGQGIPSLPAIAARILAVTALSGAAFLLAGKWKVLLFVGFLAGAGILLYRYGSERLAERQAQRVHDCAVAKVATKPRCTPPDGNGLEVCEPNPTAQQEDAAVAAAEKDCAPEISPKRKSAHEEIEDYKRQHGIAQ